MISHFEFLTVIYNLCIFYCIYNFFLTILNLKTAELKNEIEILL